MKKIVMRYPGFRSKAMTFSYDDGVIHDRRFVKILNDHGLKGTFNINAGMFCDKRYVEHMPAEEAIELYTSGGHEVAAHGYKHLSLTEVTPEQAYEDIITDRIALEKLLGIPVRGMAYASGYWNDEVVEIIRSCGLEYARTTRATFDFSIPKDWLQLMPTCYHFETDIMEMAKKFLALPGGKNYADDPHLFYLWGHSYEFDNGDGWNMIERFTDLVSDREEIWYATNIQVYDYVKAYENLKFAADQSFVYNPNLQDVYVNCDGREIRIPSDKVVSLQ